MVYLNWSHFKSEFSGKLEEDVEAHLLRTNNWMNAHHFLEGIKVSRFCLTLVGEASLWYESLQPINIDWQCLQNLYSKIGNTREQLFPAWRSFHFDKNTETIDAYVTCIKQVATLLGFTTAFRSFQKHTPDKILLGIISHRRPKTTGRDSEKNISKRKDR